MKQLDPKAVWLFFFNSILTSFIPLIFLSIFGSPIVFNMSTFFIGNEGSSFSIIFTWLAIFIIIYLILCFIWAKLTYHFYRYELTENGFRKELGVIYKKYVTIPYDRIQNVDIHRGILARLLGLSDLNIQTAGFSGTAGFAGEGRLPATSMKVAEELRDELIRRSRQTKNQGL